MGPTRRVNEDYAIAVNLRSSQEEGLRHVALLVVADGVGGGPAGRDASRLAAQSFARGFFGRLMLQSKASTGYKGDIENSFLEAHQEVILAPTRGVGRRGMATTLTAAFLDGPELHLGHVGDSRCYVIRRRERHQLSKDQSVGSSLLQSIGGSETPTPLTLSYPLQLGDLVLVCSDGLTKALHDREIIRVASAKKTVRAICENLVRDAIKADGSDNVTVCVARVVQG